MKIWGADESLKVEFMSYHSNYREQVLNLIRTAFFQHETVSVSSEINKNTEAQKELELLCENVLKKSSVSIIARDVESDKVVGAALNVVQVKETSSDAPTYFERFRDEHCKTENAISLMNYMIVSDSRCDVFEKFHVDSLLEIMFLAVFPEHRGKGIGFNLCKFSIELARDLKNGRDVEKYFAKNQYRPKLIAALWTGRRSQSVGLKLGFEVVYEESFANFSFQGKTFAEKVGDLTLTSQLAVKKI